MNVTVKTLPRKTVELTIEISPEEMKPYTAKAVQRISTRGAIPGFRRGKAPEAIVRQRYGGQVIFEEAAQLAIEGEYPKAVTDQKLETIGQPKIAVEKLADGNPFIFKATVALLPAVKLGDYASFKTKRETITIDDAKVQETLEELRRLRQSEIVVQRPAKAGDRIDIDFTLSLDRVPVDGGSSQKFPAYIGQGRLVPGFEDQLIGLTAGQEKSFNLKYPKDYVTKNLANREVEVKVKTGDVYEVTLPEVDDTFIKTLGDFATVDDLKKQLRDNLRMEGELKEEQRYELALLDELIGRSDFNDFPEILVEAELNKMMHELKHGIESNGQTFAQYLEQIHKSEPEVRAGLAGQADRRLKSALILRTIAGNEKIEATKEELDIEVAKAQKQYANDTEGLRQSQTEEFRDYLRTYVINRKVINWLTDKAKKQTA